jgi:periplasmic protein TonB
MTSSSLAQLQPQHMTSARRDYAQGWTLSFVFHGLIVFGAVLLVSDLKLVPQPEPFKWDVAMVQPRPSEAPPSPAPEQPVPTQPPKQPTETRPVEPKPIVQQVQRIQPVQRVVHQEIREVRPIVRTTSEPQRTVSPKEAVPVQTETVTIPKNEPVIREAVAEPMPMRTAEPVASESSVEATPPEAVVSETPVEAPAPVPPVNAVPEVPEAPMVATTAPVERPAVVHERPVHARPAPRADYSWLAEALWNRVERMKRYPYLARMNRWEGKVVLEAVIRDDGSVSNLKVAQSSGYAVLDKDAMEVLKKASPLSLKHPLGQPEVVVQVPISYRLER